MNNDSNNKDRDFIDLSNYNIATQQVVMSNHLIDQLHVKRLSNKANQIYSLMVVQSRLSGYGFFMTKGFISIDHFKSIHLIKDQLALKNMNEAVKELKSVIISVYHYVKGSKRNIKIKQDVSLFSDLKIVNSEHGKGICYEFNHILTQLLENRFRKAEYFKLYAVKHRISNDKYDFYENLLSENIFKLCSIDFGFTVNETTHFTNLAPESLINEFKLNPIFSEKINLVDENARLASSQQYKYFSKTLLATTQCFDGLHTHRMHSFVLSKLATIKERYETSEGDKVLVNIITSQEIRESLGFNLPKYDDNYELQKAVEKLIVDLNKYSDFFVDLKKLQKAGNRGLSAQFQLTITNKSATDLNEMKSNALRYKVKKGDPLSKEFGLLRNFTIRNQFTVDEFDCVKVISKSLFIIDKVKTAKQSSGTSFFSAKNEQYSQAHVDPTVKPTLPVKSYNANISKKVNTLGVCTEDNLIVIECNENVDKLKSVNISWHEMKVHINTTDLAVDKINNKILINVNAIKEFKRGLGGIGLKRFTFDITANYKDDINHFGSVLI